MKKFRELLKCSHRGPALQQGHAKHRMTGKMPTLQILVTSRDEGGRFEAQNSWKVFKIQFGQLGVLGLGRTDRLQEGCSPAGRPD